MKDKIEAVYTYLMYDQKADTRYHSPMDKEYVKKVRKDAENIVKLLNE